MVEALADYAQLVKLFRELTDVRWEETGLCCRSVRDGAPECCYRIADGEEATYTRREVSILSWLWRRDPMLRQRVDGLWVLDRAWWTPEVIRESMWRGEMADTLEMAAHPTRPVLSGPRVTGVAVVASCNGELAMERYEQYGLTMRQWWQVAVDLTGVKGYYCTDFVRGDMTVVGGSGDE